jgi:hypothetical protein
VPRLRPSTRHFLLSAGFATLVMVLAFLRTAVRLETMTGSDDRMQALKGLLAQAGFFGVILVLGIGMAWLRLVQDRRARSRRKPPLNLQ